MLTNLWTTASGPRLYKEKAGRYSVCSLLVGGEYLFEIFDDLLCGYNAGLVREDLLGKNPMDLLISIGATVFDNNQFIVQISGPAYR